MNEIKKKYIETLRGMFQHLYGIIKNYNLIAKEVQVYIRGYMAAGRALGIVSKEELAKIMDEESHNVFGIGTETRKRKYHPEQVSVDDSEYLKIPALIRREIKVW
jgi:hypothetical protein